MRVDLLNVLSIGGCFVGFQGAVCFFGGGSSRVMESLFVVLQV